MHPDALGKVNQVQFQCGTQKLFFILSIPEPWTSPLPAATQQEKVQSLHCGLGKNEDWTHLSKAKELK